MGRLDSLLFQIRNLSTIEELDLVIQEAQQEKQHLLQVRKAQRRLPL